MTFRWILLTAVAIVALLAGILAREYWQDGAPEKAEPAGAAAILPEASARLPVLSDVQGNPHDFSEWKGKVLIINFWATWCEPCREEMPEFVRIQQEFAGQGLQFIGVALDEPEDVERFLAETPVNYPILMGGDGAIPWAESLGNRYGVLPFSAVLDRSGHLIGSKQGTFKKDDLLKMVQPLFSSHPGH